MDLTFKPIPSLTKYQVSTTGVILGQKGQVLRLDKIKGGYLRFRPCVDNKMTMMLVHRAVLLTHLGDPPDDERIYGCHRDGNPAHNDLTNLYWGTFEDNWRDRIKHGNDGRGEKNGRAKFTQEKADELRDMYATGNYSYLDLASHFGISQAQANKIGRGLYWPTHPMLKGV